MTLAFGKYKGIKLSELYSIDKEYLIWLACNSKAVRKKAQEVFISMFKNELASKKLDLIHEGVSDSLNYSFTFMVDGERISAGCYSKPKNGFKAELVYDEYCPMIFKNNYQGKGVKKYWSGATFNRFEKGRIKITI